MYWQISLNNIYSVPVKFLEIGGKLVEYTDIALNLKEMPFAKKIKLLSETDKAYIRGYIEKAVLDYQKSGAARPRKQKKTGDDDSEC
jgi:hypothetical protein